MFMQKSVKMLVFGLITLFFCLILSGCYTPRNTLPKDLFLQVQRVDKPTIQTLDDIQASYIKLFEAYELNLNLLKTLENSQKK